MPNASGTANTASQVLQAINTLVTANGWTKLRGETDNACASPKSARYWRMLWIETESPNLDYRELNAIEFRTTLGGAAISGTWSTPGTATGSPPGYFRSSDIDDFVYWVKLDAGSPTIVREVSIQCQTDGEAPRDFYIQWSNDDLTWTTMFKVEGEAWIDNETKIYQFDDGYLHPGHDTGTDARRVGFDVRTDNGSVYSMSNAFSEWGDDRFIWQAPGYDADRRVYIQAQGHSNLIDSTNSIRFVTSPEYDGALPGFFDQVGGPAGSEVILIFDINPVDYWIYMNNTRLIVVIKSGADDYTSAYVGFLGAFADPDNYPHPLFMSATSYQFDAFNVVNNRLSSMADPGFDSAYIRLWDNTWYSVWNRQSQIINNIYDEDRDFTVWPYHCGGAGRGDWPFVWIGDHVDFDNHFLNQQDPTDQGDYPLYPAIVQHRSYGNIGALQGVYVIPGALVTPEQVLTIDAVDYRVFPNRNRRNGCNWFCVRED